MMFKTYLTEIINRNNLSADQMYEMINAIFSGNITDAQIGAFMAALATKGETFEELAGAARAMRDNAIKINCNTDDVIDTCGTGGDGADTFNISTTTAFVVAGCGLTVAKHGNRSISSKCGSADVLEKLGVNLSAEPSKVEKAIQETGIGFMFAPAFHGAMKHAVTARKETGIRSIFNMLGPLTNPASANYQLIGVYAKELTDMFANALSMLDVKKALVVHGDDGLDEISVCDKTTVSQLKDGEVSTFTIEPEMFFGKRYELSELKGGDADDNALITKAILSGEEKGAKRDVVLINAGAALLAANKVEILKQGIDLSAEAIDSGKALKKLNDLIAFSA